MTDGLFHDIEVAPAWSAAEAAFEKARKAYPKKANLRGHDREWADFRRHNRKTYKTVAFDLYPAIQVIIAWKARELSETGWTAPWKDFVRFCKDGVWEQAVPLKESLKPPAPREPRRKREAESIGEIVTVEQKRAMREAYEARTGKKLI